MRLRTCFAAAAVAGGLMASTAAEAGQGYASASVALRSGPGPSYGIITVIPALIVLAYVLLVNTYTGIPAPVLLLAIVALVMMYVSNNTRFGRYVYALGGNREAARLSGINITSVLFRVFTLMGFLCGVAGVVLASYVGYGTIAAGQGYELDAIAACILGGTSPLGGVGTIPGALIGALIIGSLTTGLQMMNVAPAWQFVTKAIILVLAVLVDYYFKKHR